MRVCSLSRCACQILNRDLSIAVIRLFDRIRRRTTKQNVARRLTYRRMALEAELAGKPRPEVLPPPSDDVKYEVPGLRILEALAASGLRSIRYFKEIPVRCVVLLGGGGGSCLPSCGCQAAWARCTGARQPATTTPTCT